MRSIKPGRGSSLQGAIGSLFAVVFGIVWMVSAAKSGAPTPFVLMGLVFVVNCWQQCHYFSDECHRGKPLFSLRYYRRGRRTGSVGRNAEQKRKNSSAKKRKKRDQQKRLFVLLWGKSGERLRFLPFLREKVMRKNGVFLPLFFRGYTCIHCVFCL